MQKLELLAPDKIFKIIHYSNGDEPIFLEETNKVYFRSLIEKHLLPVSDVFDFELKTYRVELILKFKTEKEIPEKFREKLHLPLSNLFNSYAKSINKRYNRKGSLFRTRFERKEILI